MTFENRVEVYTAFASRRRELFADFALSHSFQGNVAFWAERIRETNDAEIAFRKLVGVL